MLLFNNSSTLKKTAPGILVVLLVIFHVYGGVYKGWNKVESDFPNYYVSAVLLQKHQLDIAYNDKLFQHTITNYEKNAVGRFSLYPPANAWIMVPLTDCNIHAAKNIWLLFSILCALTSIFLLSGISHTSYLISALVYLSIGFAFANDLYLGQIYTFLLFLFLLLLYYIPRRPALAALSAAVIAMCKFITFPFVLLAIHPQYRKAVTSFCIICLVLSVTTVYYTGLPLWMYYFHSRLQPMMTGNIFGTTPFSNQYQSVISLIANLFLDDLENNTPGIIGNYPQVYFAAKIIFYSLMVICSLIILWWFAIRKLTPQWFVALMAFVFLITEAGQASYHLLFLVPVMGLILAQKNITQGEKAIAFIFYASTGFAQYVVIKLHCDNWLLLSYARLWLILLFFAFTFYLCYKRIHGQTCST